MKSEGIFSVFKKKYLSAMKKESSIFSVILFSF